MLPVSGLLKNDHPSLTFNLYTVRDSGPHGPPVTMASHTFKIHL